MIVLALFLRGSSLPLRESIAERRLPPVPAPVRLLRPAIIAAVASVAFFLLVPYEARQAGINSLIGVVMALSLVLIIGFVGQASLVQVGLAGVAGFAVSKLAITAGIGFPLGPIMGIAAAVLLGILVAFSSLRVRGVSLAIVTMSAAVALDRFVFQNPVWGAGAAGSDVPPPEIFGVSIGNNSPIFSERHASRAVLRHPGRRRRDPRDRLRRQGAAQQPRAPILGDPLQPEGGRGRGHRRAAPRS